MTLKFTKEHEWIRIEGDAGTIGVTPYAQEQLGDVIFIELPGVGKQLEKGGDAAVVESVKAASEIYAPVSGNVIEVNDALDADPSLVNSDAMGEGWFFSVRIADPADLDDMMDQGAYDAYVKSLD